MDLLLARINAIIAEQLCVEITEVTPNKKLMNDFRADSLNIVECVMAFEEEFDIEIPDDEELLIETVDDVYKIIISKIDTDAGYEGLNSKDVSDAIESMKSRKSNLERALQYILNSSLFKDYLSRLELSSFDLYHQLKHFF